MTSLGLRARKERSEEFGDLEDEFKARINSLYWVVYFPEDGKPMSLPATYAGIELTLAERALAKVGDSFTVKFISGRYVAKIKEMGMKSYAEKCVTVILCLQGAEWWTRNNILIAAAAVKSIGSTAWDKCFGLFNCFWS